MLCVGSFMSSLFTSYPMHLISIPSIRFKACFFRVRLSPFYRQDVCKFRKEILVLNFCKSAKKEILKSEKGFLTRAEFSEWGLNNFWGFGYHKMCKRESDEFNERLATDFSLSSFIKFYLWFLSDWVSLAVTRYCCEGRFS